MRNRNVLLLILLGLTGSPVVYAFQLGVFDIKPIASLQEKFDDNIHYSDANKKSDWISLLSLGLEGKSETKIETLSFTGVIEPKIFAKNDDLNNISEKMGLKYKREMSHYDRLNFDSNFVHGDESTSFKDEFGKTAGRYDYYKTLSNLAFEHDFTQQLTGKIKYTNEFYAPTLDVVSDSVLNQPGLEMGYAFSSQTIGSVYYDYANRVFDPGGTTAIHSPAVGVRQYLSNQLYVDAKAGADFIRLIDDETTTRPRYSLGLKNDLDESTWAGILFSRSYDIKYSNSDLFNNWNIYMFWGKELVERLSLNLGIFTGGGKFTAGPKMKFNGLDINFNYEVKKNIKANVGYSFTQSDSSTAANDYNKNTVFLGVTISF